MTLIDINIPIVMVHGLWNTPRIFDPLISAFPSQKIEFFVPYLEHSSGRTPLKELASKLNYKINSRYSRSTYLDIVAFSMGGLISSYWMLEFNQIKRINRFFLIGSPYKGTLTAQMIPKCLFSGIADMKIGSDFIRYINSKNSDFEEVIIKSFYTYWDLMVFPGFRGVFPLGEKVSINVFNHKSLITNRRSINVLIDSIF